MPSVQHSGERVYVHCTMRVRVRIRVWAHERVRVRVHVSARLEHSLPLGEQPVSLRPRDCPLYVLPACV